MQTKLPEHVKEPYNESNNFKNTIEINNQTNLNENDFETQNENSNFNTPKSKRIKMTITLEKQLSNRTKFNELPHLFTQKYSPFLSMSLPNKTPETFKYKQLKRDESDLNTSRLLDTDEFDIIDLTISPENKYKLEQSPINTMEIDSVALKELDSNDESLTRKKSLRKLETNESKLKEIVKEQQPKKMKRQQSASSVTSSISITTKTTKTTQNQTKPLNTFACLRNLGSTCYINCIIQVMRYTPGFVSSIHRLNKQIDYLETVNSEIETEINSNNNVKFVKNLHQLLEEMSEKEKQDRRPIYSPAKFVKTVWTLLSFWSNGSQQDAHEFLQYTIHFINECDLFLRKIHQQYQIKLPFNDEPIKQSNDTQSESILANVTTKTTTTRKTKNSQKTADPLENTLVKEQTIEETKQIKIDRRRKEFRNIQQLEKENYSNTIVQATAENSLQIVMNQKLSDRLIKSIPKLNESTNDILKNNLEMNNFLRTPTKGGASAYNFSIDESTLPVQIEPIKSDLNKSKSPNQVKKIQQKFKTDNSEFNFDLKNEPIDDKDLVSKRLKETINSASTTLIKKRPNNDINRKNEPVTKFKRETMINSNLNDSINSIIIIDSDLDDDLDDYQKRIDTDEDESEEININKAKLNERLVENVLEQKEVAKIDISNICSKELSVVIEKFNIEKLLSKNGLKLSKESLNYVKDDVKMYKIEQKIKTNQKINPTELFITTRTRNKIKKFGAKANSMLQQSDESSKLVDLDAITIINLVKPINETNKTSKNSILNSADITFKSKLRSTPTGTKSEDIPPIHSPFLLASNLMKTFSQSTIQTSIDDSNSSKLPPSPAELLRKYSTSNGYTCEMDKLFKGSSVTVTQCLECENLRKCPEAFYDRSIPLDTNDDLNDDNSTNWISKCLSNESYLNDNSKYMCDKCSSKQEAKIHTQYTQMPNILILHLLSYGITSSIDGNMNAQKLSNRSRLVSYFDYVCAKEQTSSLNNHLNLSNFDGYNSPISTRNYKRQRNSEEQHKNLKHQFKLFAVVMHSGTTLNSGHYTAYVNYKIISQSNSIQDNLSSLKNEKSCSCFIDNNKLIQTSSQNDSNLISNKNTNHESEWLHFDDTKVKSLSNIEFHRKIIDSNYDSPYILFYVKE